jgi:hypothetical protein
MKALLLCLALTAAAWCEPVTSFEGGTENRTTERFQVNGPWKLSWDFQGMALKVFIYTDRAGPTAKPIAQAGSGKGSIDIAHPGTYWLEIKSVGTYKMNVETADVNALPVFEGNLERKGTPVFTAPKGWGYRWNAQGVFKATLYDEQRNRVGTPAVGVGGGSGESVIGKPGKYFFMIQSSGPYRIQIFQGR